MVGYCNDLVVYVWLLINVLIVIVLNVIYMFENFNELLEDKFVIRDL